MLLNLRVILDVLVYEKILRHPFFTFFYTVQLCPCLEMFYWLSRGVARLREVWWRINKLCYKATLKTKRYTSLDISLVTKSCH